MLGRPGQRARHSSGAIATISHRKSDDTGWWIEGGGGISDGVLAGPDWDLLPLTTEDELRAEIARLNRLIERAKTAIGEPCPYVVTTDEGTSHCRLAEASDQ